MKETVMKAIRARDGGDVFIVGMWRLEGAVSHGERPWDLLT